MAKKVVYMDDLDENVEADAGTVTFAFDGSHYEIDLSAKNKAKLQALLGPYVNAARRAGRSSTTKKSSGGGYSSEHLQAVRDWGRRNGYTVSDKGRVPAEVMLAFEQAQEAPAKKAAPRQADPAELVPSS